MNPWIVAIGYVLLVVATIMALVWIGLSTIS